MKHILNGGKITLAFLWGIILPMLISAGKSIHTTWLTIKSKAIAIIALAVLMEWYHNIPKVVFNPETGTSTGGMPFADLLYTGIIVLYVFVVMSICRLFVFREAAHYAESGQITTDLDKDKPTTSLWHYWFATAVSILVALYCAGTMSPH